MSIVSADLMLFASAQMNDNAYGGGRMSGTTVQDGVDNNTFPDVDVAARTNGRTQIRKVYAAVVSHNDDLASGGQINFVNGSGDDFVDEVAFVFGDHKTERAAAVTALLKMPYRATTFTSGWQFIPAFPNECFSYVDIPEGSMVAFFGGAFPFTGVVNLLLAQAIRYVVSSTVSGSAFRLVMSGPVGDSAGAFSTVGTLVVLEQNPLAPACVGISTLTGTSGANYVDVNWVDTPVVPNTTPYPVMVNGIDPLPLKLILGRVPIFRAGDTVIVRNGATTERALVSFVDHRGRLDFAENLANSYPVGSTVSSLGNLGDLRASVGASFSQQTWTKAFSDSLIGAGISANYDRTAGTIGITNFGGETERWAIVFTSSTAFKLIGEVVGQIATGDTSTLFEPNNPITGEPYFSIPAAGWGSGWAIGNVLRFNTVGARAPFWEVRTVSPSPPGSADSMTIEFCVSA